MIRCLVDISSNTGYDLDCEEWVSVVNRGGLWQINGDVYGVFCNDGGDNSTNFKKRGCRSDR